MGRAAARPDSVRSLRRDAERNRQRILRAAAEVFNAYGLRATLDDVARQAGVGVGTVYRRFPSKEALSQALFAVADRALAEPDPWAGLITFLEQAVELLVADRGLRQMLMFRTYGQEQVAQADEQMRRRIGGLLRRAQRAGAVRDDISPGDIVFIEYMVAMAGEYVRDVRPTAWRRYLTLITDGLRPDRPGPAALPEPPLSRDEADQVTRSRPVS
jgi:AcrR family transcriptional regulator